MFMYRNMSNKTKYVCLYILLKLSKIIEQN